MTTETYHNPFLKFSSKDPVVTAMTDKDGNVVKLIKSKPYPVKSGTIIQKKGIYIYQFPCKEENLMRIYKDGVGINYAFFNNFDEEDIFIVSLIRKIGKKKEITEYAITKKSAIEHGKVATHGKWDEQNFVSLKYWEKIS